ncbi:type IV secretory system conjugative DNA transfer family protein [Rickettsia endosymbiont of Polydrusus tereticollis]|uniref:type IV secretory system conjugative DNA transfer family protein n=1 Tax=Rickettsia endosymbiont of Polydrusus tereticollis TaxID=3066251 RepID=UPI003132A669
MHEIPIKAIINNWDFFKIFEIIFENYVPDNIKQQGYKALLIGFGISLIIPLLGLMAINRLPKETLYGDAKFATLKDILNSKAVSYGNEKGRGIIVGKFRGKLIRYTKPDFVSLGAGTRSGKGAGVVIPNLLEWQESLIILDIKQECYNITSKYRQDVLKQEVFLFNPFSFNTHQFNPFYYINLDETEGSTDLMGMAEIIYPTDNVTGAEKHFNNSAQSLFIALAKTLWILLQKNLIFLQEHNIANIFSIGNLFVLYNTVLMNDLTEILEENLSLKKLNALQIELAKDGLAKIRSFMLLGDEGKASVMATFEKQLKLFALSVVKNATDDNSFDFRDSRRKKMTIYLSIAPKDLKIASLILNLFFNCAIKINLSENPDFIPELKYSLLLILDEFPAIGNIPYIKEAAGYIAGYKIQLLTIFQNVSQLNEIYEDQGRKTLLANHSCKIVFAPNEQDDAEYFSKEIAYTTTKSTSESRNTNQTYVSQGKSKSEAKRALMLPQELKQLPFEQEIILLNGENPIRCEKALYYNDRFFMDKLISLSSTLQLYTNKKKLPTKEQLAIALNKGELAINFK